jgi:protease II
VLGTDPSVPDECVYHEADDAFYVGIGRSRSERVLYLHSGEEGWVVVVRRGVWWW